MNNKLLHNKQFLNFIGSDWGGLYVDLKLIEQDSTVISAGLGSDVSFDLALMELKNCTVIGIDPTQTARDTVFETADGNPLFAKNFRYVQRALLDVSDREITLGGPAVTFISPHGEHARTVCLNDVYDKIDREKVSFLKLDIEAAEYPVIQSFTPLPSMAQIGISFHHWLNGPTDQYPNPGATCPYTLDDTVACIEKIKSFGYKLVHIDNADPLRYFQEVLFIRSDLAEKYKDLTFEYEGNNIKKNK